MYRVIEECAYRRRYEKLCMFEPSKNGIQGINNLKGPKLDIIYPYLTVQTAR